MAAGVNVRYEYLVTCFDRDQGMQEYSTSIKHHDCILSTSVICLAHRDLAWSFVTLSTYRVTRVICQRYKRLKAEPYLLGVRERHSKSVGGHL